MRLIISWRSKNIFYLAPKFRVWPTKSDQTFAWLEVYAESVLRSFFENASGPTIIVDSDRYKMDINDSFLPEWDKSELENINFDSIK